ncbi:MAG TPA: NAD(P)H-hydrate dehydratase, partial [Pyrinomonadaceae bacterium]|nr:NAD(P)H-hydrate dehydratase [Pyrinomonadaceae bacterium]
VSVASIKRDPREGARRAADNFRAVVALKGRETTIVAPHDPRVFCNRAGNVGLATSGSGDVLAGLCAGLSARGAAPLQAAVWAVYLHARAGDQLARRVGPLGYLARELSAEVPRLLAELSGRG